MIDLHSHTTASDGSLPPGALVALAVEQGLEALAITDHDTLAGYDQAAAPAREAGLDLICGVELSTRPHLTALSQRPPSVHLLGYFLDGEPSAAFRAWLGSHQESRRARNRALIERLRQLGVEITLPEVEAIGGSLTGRPHFARILQQKGYVQSRQEAFDVYLADNAQAGVERDEPGLIEGIRRIREGGGLASLAHPVRLEASDPEFLRKFLPPLVEAGLQGLEVYHSDHTEDQSRAFAELAREFGLTETGGSDFHGDNKPGVALGTGRGSLALDAGMLAGMRRIAQRAPTIHKGNIPMQDSLNLTHLQALEAESIFILREVAAEFQKPVMLYSIGKDSSVMLRLAEKAFHPGKIPFSFLHIDTTYKFREMIEFRDKLCAQLGVNLTVHINQEAIDEGASPFKLGTQKCCGLLKTKSLLDALREGGYDAAFGGARRDEEKSRAKERIYSFRDGFGQWDPKNQRPELWNVFNSKINKGESIRVFPLSNWTEMDVWQYIHVENIPIVPLYFAKEREVLVRGNSLIPIEHNFPLLPGERPQMVKCRMRSLGCSYCTGAIRSDADTVPKIIDELLTFRRSERELRAIDHDEEGSMEMKKREGYF